MRNTNDATICNTMYVVGDDATLFHSQRANDDEIAEYRRKSFLGENMTSLQIARDRTWITVLKDIAAGEECFRHYGAGAWWADLSLPSLIPQMRQYYDLDFKRILSNCIKEERYNVKILIRSLDKRRLICFYFHSCYYSRVFN
jgi:hypothetical protein